jgi:hypothetical protein
MYKFNKLVQDLHNKNYKILIKETLKKWKNIPFSWILRLSIFKLLVILKLMYRFSAIPTIISASLSCGYCQIDSQIYMEGQNSKLSSQS